MAAIGLGACYLYFASQMRASSLADSFGPQGMPLVYGWLMLGLGVVLVLQWLVATSRSSSETRQAAHADAWRGQGRKILRAGGLFGLAAAYLPIVQTLGYLPSMALLTFAVALYLGAPLTWRPVAIGIGGAIVLWLIFVQLLGVPMPRGILSAFGL
ncbi:tripartite tricarboxylate transporter TctB family protein [Paracoccus beibuensis]|uniref:tripartite tricarboxylate transporter TctB family protein n=1 Tax=Paracoccus beibuensis TaxID=547602 RepID=UPI00223F699D|nr:tripartite tricarboxylate transporter TctB family protein [Paracoccus beibuensis]